MKYSRLLLLIAALALLSAAVGAAPLNPLLYKFPSTNPMGLVQYTPFQMFQGWENNQLTWYIATDSSDQQIACETALFSGGRAPDEFNFAPALSSLAGQVATMYVIVNLNQGPVFTDVPGGLTYSGLWQVVFVTYNPGVDKHYVKNAAPFDPVLNPYGLPSNTDATFTTLNKAGLPIVVKFPIVAVGPLGGPWAPSIPGEYRIPQGKVQPNYTYTKQIFLPYWQVYCKDPVTKRVCLRSVAIPDAFDPIGLPVSDQLVPKLGANSAPGLGLINQALTQPFYWQIGIQPLTQYPILHACTNENLPPCYNNNYDYIPVETVVVMQRNVPPLPASTIINNEQLLLQFLGSGFLTQIRASQIINATVIEEIPRG